jgi:peptide/nickel transport system permease protein
MEPLGWGGIFAAMFVQFTPVWIGLALIFALSIRFKRRLSLYGKLMNSPIGMIGLGIVLFWVLTVVCCVWATRTVKRIRTDPH